MSQRRGDKKYGQRLISLFAELYFTGQPRSLIELTKKLDCSKQTVKRLVDDISDIYQIDIYEFFSGRRLFYQIRRPEKLPRNLSMSPSELSLLYMCLGFTRHLLGKDLLEDSEKAIQKSSTLAAGGGIESDHFAAFLPGTIDYTPRQQDIRQLVKAMDEKRICRIVYKRPMTPRAKTFYIKPYKLFSYNNALYLHAGMARYPGVKYQQFEYDPLLAVHRLQKVELTERNYTFPEQYDFEKHFNQEFGVIKQEAFQVQLELTGYAAVFAQERRLSPDQQVKKKKDGVILTFTSSSKPEAVSWILSMGEEARVLEPDWLVAAVGETIEKMRERYQ